MSTETESTEVIQPLVRGEAFYVLECFGTWSRLGEGKHGWMIDSLTRYERAVRFKTAAEATEVAKRLLAEKATSGRSIDVVRVRFDVQTWTVCEVKP